MAKFEVMGQEDKSVVRFRIGVSGMTGDLVIRANDVAVAYFKSSTGKLMIVAATAVEERAALAGLNLDSNGFICVEYVE